MKIVKLILCSLVFFCSATALAKQGECGAYQVKLMNNFTETLDIGNISGNIESTNSSPVPAKSSHTIAVLDDDCGEDSDHSCTVNVSEISGGSCTISNIGILFEYATFGCNAYINQLGSQTGCQACLTFADTQEVALIVGHPLCTSN